jgi:hypothetical protein
MLKTPAEKRKIEVIEYVKNEIEKGRHPSYKELQNKYNISYFDINLDTIYSNLGIKFLHIPKRRPTGCNEILKKELIEYVKNEIQNGHYPSRREIEKKFRVHISVLFGNIENLYISAGSRYVQKNSQEIKKRKADILMDLVLYILPKLHLEFIKQRDTRETGIDILAKNKDDEIVGIELKAYNKYEKIKERDIDQLKKFLIKEKLNRGILISTTSGIQSNLLIPPKIKIILFDDFLKFCNKDMLHFLNFIRTYSIHRETYELDNKRRKIIEYAKNKAQNGEDISHKKILNYLKLDCKTYFKSIYEVYKEADIPIPTRKIKGRRSKTKFHKTTEDLLNKILAFVKEEVNNNHYPSGIDIGKKFGISHIWNFVKTSDIYHRLGLPAYLEREKRK